MGLVQSMCLTGVWSGKRWRKGAGLCEHSEREFYYDSIQESCMFDCQVLPLIVCNAFLCVYVGCVYVVLVGTSHSLKGLSTLGTNSYTHRCYYYASGLNCCVSCLVCCLPFLLVFPMINFACWTGVMLQSIRLLKSQRFEWPPASSAILNAYEGLCQMWGSGAVLFVVRCESVLCVTYWNICEICDLCHR